MNQRKTKWLIVAGIISAGCLIFIICFKLSSNASTSLLALESSNDQSGSAVSGSAIEFLRKNGGIVHYNEAFDRRMKALSNREARSRDPELIELARYALDPPCTNQMLKLSHYVMKTPQVEEVERLLHSKTKGFFIECGALDGERSSNTLFLENDRGWTGLLVEMDPFFYTQLLGKCRRSYSINACLSPYEHAVQLPFKGHTGGMGKINLVKDNLSTTVPCFPLETILLALNRSHVDYFSLDVEGVELDILKTIPFDRITVNVFSVEYRHTPNAENTEGAKKEMITYMTSKGYTLVKDIVFENPVIALYVKDFIFIRNVVV